jgi:hypothetical protein
MSSQLQPDRSARLPDPSSIPAEPAATPHLIANMRASIQGFWADASGYQRLAYLVGAALITIGLAHAGMWALAGGSASGPLSWRRPTSFGISFGLTTLTLGWVGLYLPVPGAIAWTAAGLLCASTTYEVAWVVTQHARGVLSHLNDTTPLDERLFILGAVMVAIAILVIAAMTLAAFVRTTAPAPMALAIRSGLAGLLAAQITGCGCSYTAWRSWTPTPTLQPPWDTRPCSASSSCAPPTACPA